MNDNNRGIWMAIFSIMSLLIGGATARLSWLGNVGLPGSILAGGAAFAGALVLLIAIYNFMH
jgi:hypothetical protein